MKPFKQILSEVSQPRAKATKEFKDLHDKSTKKVDHTGHYNYTQPKTVKDRSRPADRQPGEDKEQYDAIQPDDGSDSVMFDFDDDEDQIQNFNKFYDVAATGGDDATYESVSEAVVLKNKEYGFAGTMPDHKKHLPKAAKLVHKALSDVQNAHSAAMKKPGHLTPSLSKKITGQKVDHKLVGHFLDSAHGRHLADYMKGDDHSHIPKTLRKAAHQFMNNYDPQLFESMLEEMLAMGEIVEHVESLQETSSFSDMYAAIMEAGLPPVTAVGAVFSNNPVKADKARGKLRIMMRDPMPAAKSAEALASFVFDGKLLDQIKSFADKDPNVDVRPVIRKRMKELGIQI